MTRPFVINIPGHGKQPEEEIHMAAATLPEVLTAAASALNAMENQCVTDLAQLAARYPHWETSGLGVVQNTLRTTIHNLARMFEHLRDQK